MNWLHESIEQKYNVYIKKKKTIEKKKESEIFDFQGFACSQYTLGLLFVQG